MDLLIKVNDSQSATPYKDGDVVRAISQDDIFMCHADEKCNVMNFGFTTDGMRVPDPLLIKFLEKTQKYKFERLNSNEVRRTNLVTNEQDIVSNTPNEKGEAIDVFQYVTRRIKSKRHLIFRDNGLEYWYGVRKRIIDTEAVWNDIETHSDFLKLDHCRFPFSDYEKRMFMPINCCTHTCEDNHYHDDTCINCTCHCDLSECPQDKVAEKTMPVVTYETDSYTEIDEETGEQIPYNEMYKTILHKRKFQVPYWDFSGSDTLSINVDDVRNPDKIIDERVDHEQRANEIILTVDKIEAGIVTL